MEEPQDHQDTEEQEDLDEADGIGRLIGRNMGRYKPKQHEEEDKCNVACIEEEQDLKFVPLKGALSDYEDPDDHIFQLLRATSPDAAWREGLSYLMKGDDREHVLRITLAFLHNNVATGILMINEGSGPGSSVNIDSSKAPNGISCADWMKLLEGLGFELTSPGVARNIDFVDVTLARKTNVEVLQGFCCLMQSMLELSWINLQLLLKLHQDDGQMLWETVTLLRSGAGIQPSSRARLQELEDEFPYFMKCLGFTRDKKNNNRLQWERSGGQLDRIYWTLHGLFRRTDVLESPA